jgi:hypothetical protein
MMGIISSGMVVTGTERRGRPKSVQPGNREWITVIQAINTEGWAIQPFIIAAGQYHLATWYRESNLPDDWAIATAPKTVIEAESQSEYLERRIRRHQSSSPESILEASKSFSKGTKTIMHHMALMKLRSKTFDRRIRY